MFSRAAVANAREGGPGVHRISGAPPFIVARNYLQARFAALRLTPRHVHLAAAEHALKQANAYTRSRETDTDVSQSLTNLELA